MATQPAPGSFTLDPARSTVRFRHKTMWGMVTVNGSFAAVHGAGEVAADGSAAGTLVVQSASLDTKHKKRDIHLRSKDFFDSEAHPEITFTATRVTPAIDGTAQVEGELTVRGTSRKLTFPARYETQGTQSVALTGSLQVAREDYGMGWNQLGMMKGVATIELDLRFTAAN